MMRFAPVVLVFLVLLTPLCTQAQEASSFTPNFDLRMRQEVFDGVLFFAPDPDRNQLRFRTRGGVSYQSGEHTLKVQLANEHRRYLHPDDIDFDWDELIIDNLFWKWQNEDIELTLGRQNIIWDEGFLMLEGKPYDGSRSIFHDAARLKTTFLGYQLDAALIYNTKRDEFVLAGDDERALRDADELGLAARFAKNSSVTTYIFKREDDPDENMTDLTTHTLSSRYSAGSKDGVAWQQELVAQYKRFGKVDHGSSWDLLFAGHVRLDFNLCPKARGHAGFLFYQENFRTPWGRWPLWSEMYIYTLIGESRLNRVHVAAWEDVAGPYLGLKRTFSEDITGKVRAYYLMSPDTDWDGRGLLLQTRVDFQLHEHAKAHLLWEMLSPGDFHKAQSPALDETVHFLRWEVILSL